ncbi:UrcA family protein [Sphingomonas glaciei]|uniref:UrcA family protein n=1 Tax=Sphingomonas glaciei TaxID=2938948 RepID=A0ABY5MZ10_9SPHN|nr:UrcA family protein [Sphingomonas glaciei]UUR07591.1 UrcA family protein [Sphingomonas glaciei]
MHGRNFATLIAAGVIGLSLTAAAAYAQPPKRDVVVEGKRFDPETQRIVRYGDLNLAYRPDQKLLMHRISRTARALCYDLGYASMEENWPCRNDAIDSTDDQVAAAIARAKDKLAGRPVGPAIAISMVIGSR